VLKDAARARFYHAIEAPKANRHYIREATGTVRPYRVQIGRPFVLNCRRFEPPWCVGHLGGRMWLVHPIGND